MSSSMLFGTDPRLAPIRITDTATGETPNPNYNTNPNPNSNPNDLINIKFHEHNYLLNIMSSSMLFDKDIRLAPIRIPDTVTEEALNRNDKFNNNPNPNDLINIMSHQHNDPINIMFSSMLFGTDPRLAPIRIPETATEETPNPNYNPNPNPNNNPNDLINIKFHEHNDLINIMSSSMLFGKDPRLAPVRIKDTATEEAPNTKSNPNNNPNLNDLINVMSHEHNDVINIMFSSM